jgi:hypothetical protein
MRMWKRSYDNTKIKPIGESGSGSYPMAGFSTGSVEPSGSATRDLVNIKMGLREIGCEDGRWIKLAQDRVQ